MKFNKNLLKEKWFSYTVALCSAVILYLVLTHISSLKHFLGDLWRVGAPVFMAFVIAYVLAPLVDVFSKYVLHKVTPARFRHSLSVLLSILSVILFFVILMVALVPQVIDSIVMFVGNLNGYVLSFQQLMRRLSSFAAAHDIDLTQFITSSDELLQSITRILPENVNKIVNLSYGFGAKLFDWIISFILAVYLMLDSQNLRDGFKRLLHALLPPNVYGNTASFLHRCNTILIRYIAFDVLDGMIIGLLNWFFMVLMQMPYVAIISAVVGITNLAPTFGPMAGAVIGAFILVLVKPWYALVFLLFTLVLQTIDGYVIKPRLFGEQLGVSSVWILISLIIGGRLLGVAGILLAIPFAAIGDFVYHDYLIKRLEKQRYQKLSANAGTLLAAQKAEEAIAKAVGEAAAAAVLEQAQALQEAVPGPERPADAEVLSGTEGPADAVSEPKVPADAEVLSGTDAPADAVSAPKDPADAEVLSGTEGPADAVSAPKGPADAEVLSGTEGPSDAAPHTERPDPDGESAAEPAADSGNG